VIGMTEMLDCKRQLLSCPSSPKEGHDVLEQGSGCIREAAKTILRSMCVAVCLDACW